MGSRKDGILIIAQLVLVAGEVDICGLHITRGYSVSR